jgi:hypothetical protein
MRGVKYLKMIKKVLLLLLENRDTNLDASTIKQGINHNRQFSQAEVILAVYMTYTTVHHIQRDMIAASSLAICIVTFHENVLYSDPIVIKFIRRELKRSLRFLNPRTGLTSAI